MACYSVVRETDKQKKRRKRKRKIVTFTAMTVFLAILFALFFYRRSMNPVILDIAQTRVKAETTLAINEAVSVVLADNVNYTQFVNVERNAQNDIVLLSANSALVNDLARDAAIVTQRKLEEIKSFEVAIPIGTLSGIPLLSELGRRVAVTVAPIGKVNCNFTSTFEAAGINQTLHRIYINVESCVDLIIPSSHTRLETNTPILLCESVIVGKVPDTFLQGGLVLGRA